jgi:bacterioferritin-associated ferredoxin
MVSILSYIQKATLCAHHHDGTNRYAAIDALAELAKPLFLSGVPVLYAASKESVDKLQLSSPSDLQLSRLVSDVETVEWAASKGARFNSIVLLTSAEGDTLEQGLAVAKYASALAAKGEPIDCVVVVHDDDRRTYTIHDYVCTSTEEHRTATSAELDTSAVMECVDRLSTNSMPLLLCHDLSVAAYHDMVCSTRWSVVSIECSSAYSVYDASESVAQQLTHHMTKVWYAPAMCSTRYVAVKPQLLCNGVSSRALKRAVRTYNTTIRGSKTRSGLCWDCQRAADALTRLRSTASPNAGAAPAYVDDILENGWRAYRVP